MDYYAEIKNRLVDNEIYARVKDYSKERNRVATYFEIGRLLSEAGGKYGDNIIGEYSKKLTAEVGKQYNRRTLFRMKQLYERFRDEKVSPVVTQLTWTHCVQLLSIKDRDELLYYLNVANDERISKRELERRIKSGEYRRLPKETRDKLHAEEPVSAIELVKDPIIIKSVYNGEILSEKILQRIILEDIEHFMRELGDSFSFVGSEYKIRVGDTYNYIDLLLFNYKYNCFVVVELKTTELKKSHIGQIQVYMNCIDNTLRNVGQNKTIGIIICKKENQYIIKYCSDERIIAREYKLTWYN